MQACSPPSPISIFLVHQPRNGLRLAIRNKIFLIVDKFYLRTIRINGCGSEQSHFASVAGQMEESGGGGENQFIHQLH